MRGYEVKRKGGTLSKLLPSLTSGVVGKERSELRVKFPFSMSYRFDMSSRRSEVFFTGRKRDRGTFMPIRMPVGRKIRITGCWISYRKLP